MNRSATPKLAAYAGLAALGLLAALAARLPELAAVAAPEEDPACTARLAQVVRDGLADLATGPKN